MSQNSEMTRTSFGWVFTAELEDGSVEAVSAEAAAKTLRWINENADLPETIDTVPLEIMIAFLEVLALERPVSSRTGNTEAST